MGNQWSPDSVYEVLASEHARKILAMTSQRSMSAQEIADRLEIAEPTVYRRLNVLEEYDFLSTDRKIDQQGNHYETYEAALERLEVSVGDGQLEYDVELQGDLIDEFTEFWTDFGTASRGETTEDPLDDD